MKNARCAGALSSRFALAVLCLHYGTTFAFELMHKGGGLTSEVMRSTISKLPPPPAPSPSGVNDGSKLMRTVHLEGDYEADVPLIIPSYVRLVLNGSITALPYQLGWTEDSAGSPNQTASMVSVKNAVMVSIEGGEWDCSTWNSSSTHGNTTTVTAIYFESTSFSFIRNLKIRACGQYSGGQNSGSIGIGRVGYVSGNIRVAGGSMNLVQNVESFNSSNRGLWAQTERLIVSGSSFHHNDADGIDLDSSSSHCTIHNSTMYMNARAGIFLEFSASYNTIVGNKIYSNHFNGVGTGALDGTQSYNVVIGNTLGPSNFPPGCPVSQRPCPSFCPVADTCEEVVGLPCGTCHYEDQANYEAHGFGIGAAVGVAAVFNDLGGSVNFAGGRRVKDGLVALNVNGTVDNSGNFSNTTVFSFNPDLTSK